MSHPYKAIAPYRHWLRAGGIENASALDPVVRTGFGIAPTTRIAAAGSCFAQNVMRSLRTNGFAPLVTEEAPAILSEEQAAAFQYGVYTTRSGNVYTARQLRQLLERAFGLFAPAERTWTTADGAVVDPFRPQVARFASQGEMARDRERHLAAVRAMVERLEVLVFTLGLTEAWVDDADGALFPLAPGVAGGRYDAARHRLHVATADEVSADLEAAFALVKARNPAARLILTVSPVPLMATALDRHVLVSTAHSKATLLVAAHRVAHAHEDVDYFPSYEIVTAPHTRGAYFGPDCRQVTERGVRHVMRVFLRHYAGAEAPHPGDAVRGERRQRARRVRQREARLAKVLCDEDLLADVDPH